MFPTQVIVTLSVMAISMASAVLYTADPTHQKHMWETYKTEYHKQYVTVEEEETKFKVFLDNLKIADQRTEAERKNGGTAIHGINKFSDMSKEEFKRTYLNLKVPENKVKMNTVTIDRKVDATAGLVDWTGVYTTPVKDQVCEYLMLKSISNLNRLNQIMNTMFVCGPFTNDDCIHCTA